MDRIDSTGLMEALAAISTDEQLLFTRRAAAHSAKVLVAESLSLRREDAPHVHQLRNGVVMLPHHTNIHIRRRFVQENPLKFSRVLGLSE